MKPREKNNFLPEQMSEMKGLLDARVHFLITWYEILNVIPL